MGKYKGSNGRIYSYVGFIGLEKTYDKANREALWQVLRIYDVVLLRCIGKDI